MPSATETQSAVIHRLDNGIALALERLPYMHSVSIGVWIKAGSGCETAANAGISHFLEHLLFKGTPKRTAREIAEAIEGRGGHINAFTSREYTCVYTRVLNEHIGTAIDVLTDIVRHSQFNDLEKERNVILEEIAAAEDVPDDYIHDAFTQALWPDHPMGRPIAGYNSTVSAITFDDVQAYHGAEYTPENIVISVAGKFDPDFVMAMFEHGLGDMPSGDANEFGPCPMTQGSAQWIQRDNTHQAHLCFGFPSVTIHSENRYVCDVLNSTLGGGSTSRLFEKIREEEGLAYSVYSFNYSYPTAGMFGVYAGVAPENLNLAAELCFNEIRDLSANPMSAAEIEMNRELLKGNMLMALESTFNRMARMAKSILYHGRVIPVEEVVNRIDSVKAEDVMERAAAMFRPEVCTLTALGPGEREVADLVQL